MSAKFTTIVTTETNRAEFTALREKLNTTDKVLFTAIFSLIDEQAVAQKVLDLRNDVLKTREQKAIAKLAEKLEALKSGKPLQKAARKTKSVSKNEKRNARRRELRAQKKAAAEAPEAPSAE